MPVLKRIFVLALALNIALFTKAQYINSITAKVLDINNKPVLGNAIILSKDSNFIKGTSIVNGTFLLSNINQKSFILKLSSLSFIDTFINITYVDTDKIDVGTIIVKEKIVFENNVTVTS